MCYRFVEYSIPIGTFDPVIDCTYVLLMENSPRERTIMKTIQEAHLTKLVRVQYNKGFRKCTKTLPEQKTNFDLIHALQNVFKNALTHGYKRIVVLEDDCIFDERIHDPVIVNDLTTFLRDRDPDVYNLGTWMYLTLPWAPFTQKHHRMLVGLLAHAMVYNKKYMETTIHAMHLSPDIEPMFHFHAFTYYKPLAYQLLPETENSREGYYSIPCVSKFIRSVFRMDTMYQPGFDRMHKISQGVSIFIFILIVIVTRLHMKNQPSLL